MNRAALVLVVDDDADVRDALADLLEDEGFSVRLAANGQEALDVARESRPDVILLDLMMPVMDGWHFLSARLAEPDLVEVPIIVITAAEGPRRMASKAGVCGVVAKPLRGDDLLRQVEACLAPRAQ